MQNAELKKSLKELSAKVKAFLTEQVETYKVEEMLNDLTIAMTRYLHEIGEMGNPTLSDLAARMKRSKPSVTIAIDKLEQKGYVKRVQADEDRRAFHLHLTEKGKRFHEVGQITEDKFCEKAINALNDEEIKQLLALNKKIFG